MKTSRRPCANIHGLAKAGARILGLCDVDTRRTDGMPNGAFVYGTRGTIEYGHHGANYLRLLPDTTLGKTLVFDEENRRFTNSETANRRLRLPRVTA